MKSKVLELFDLLHGSFDQLLVVGRMDKQMLFFHRLLHGLWAPLYGEIKLYEAKET